MKGVFQRALVSGLLIGAVACGGDSGDPGGSPAVEPPPPASTPASGADAEPPTPPPAPPSDTAVPDPEPEPPATEPAPPEPAPPPAQAPPPPAPDPEPEPEPAPEPADTGPRSVYDGVFTSAQVARGNQVFERDCMVCHVAQEWSRILLSYSGMTAFDLVSSLQATMPLDAPGRLTRQEYTDVTTFMFQLNGAPAGDTELGSDDESLQGVRLEYRP
jgi:hypothetical protein